ncbi:hypothetical protein PHLGIDRAFT_122397 [Phlebiopsis gigantea 11061_1 CR5-6]|uniref:Uncharacterized protein n=1 Tax=Phlebiopsis gigantea (strain 11061_1 CR5-6) TaxID=745531 RepID=A0A0C3S0J2_PHLG1|nr:hypothetical protein PHLGIDRAFT_122397 [Phlebiopsis gigantea 11061_1 CR5-6]
MQLCSPRLHRAADVVCVVDGGVGVAVPDGGERPRGTGPQAAMRRFSHPLEACKWTQLQPRAAAVLSPRAAAGSLRLRVVLFSTASLSAPCLAGGAARRVTVLENALPGRRARRPLLQRAPGVRPLDAVPCASTSTAISATATAINHACEPSRPPPRRAPFRMPAAVYPAAVPTLEHATR